MSKQFEKLIGLLKELFQLDQPDLDFGIYRIMRAKSDELTRFLEHDLLPQVSTAFSQYMTADKTGLQAALTRAIEQATGLGVDPESTAKVRELRRKLAEESVDVGALESEVYDHLYTFFRRYYQEGDFLAKRVYKQGVYAIPYEGEEVKLHWANRDQYYIKTSEYLRDYAFTLRPGDNKDPMRVHFRLVEAAEGEHGNVKPANGKERRFILASEEPLSEENGELIIRFHYRPAMLDDWTPDAQEAVTTAAGKKPPTQKDLLNIAVGRILAVRDSQLARWIGELAKPHIRTTGEQADYSRLLGHLNRYTARNTFDYFIHKDLGGFLRRELDFYIKNEVMHLDDVESESAPRVEQYLSKIKVIRKIANKLIDFLAQIEDFQKKLWLKKKFVVETNYCITLGHIQEEFYPEIATCEAQVNEWVTLYSIDKIEGDLCEVVFSKPLTVDFLKTHKGLVVDTARLPRNLTDRILSSITQLDDIIGSVSIHADNSQALRLLKTKYACRARVAFVDFPYNTGNDDFIYKDNYRHSSWLSMASDRLNQLWSLLDDKSSAWFTLDLNEAAHFKTLLTDMFGEDKCIDVVAWEKVYSPRMDAKQFSTSFDSIIIAAKNPKWSPNRFTIEPDLSQFPHTDENQKRYRSDPLRKWGKGSRRQDRPNLWYAVTAPTGEKIFPIKPDGTEGRWRWEEATYNKRYGELDWLDKGNGLQPYVRQYAETSDTRPVETLWRYEDAGSTHEAAEELKAIIPGYEFETLKPTALVHNIFEASLGGDGLVIDIAAGSGTTAHAAINRKRHSGHRTNFIVIEHAEYFDTLLLPRLKRVIYSDSWASGLPADRKRSCDFCFKYLRLESYEDTLNNLKLTRSKPQSDLLSVASTAEGSIKEQYMLQYMLEVETRGSQSLLNISQFNQPTAYKLNIKRPGSDETKEITVDLIETFNWLIGLNVAQITAPQCLSAEFKRDPEGRLQLKGRLKEDKDGPWWFRTVTGLTPDGRKTLVIWRKLTGDAEQDNLILDAWFTKQGYSTRDYEFDLIYVNGDSNLENLRQPNDTWKVRLTEEDFHRLMFDTTGL